MEKTGKLQFLCCSDDGKTDLYFLVDPKLQKKSHKEGYPVGPVFERPCSLLK